MGFHRVKPSLLLPSAFLQRFEVLQKASLQRLLLLVKKAEESTLTGKQAADVLRTTSKEIMELKEGIALATAKLSTSALYLAKMDHLVETEDELVFMAGDQVRVIQKMSTLCWLGSAAGLVGSLDPRMLLNLTELGLTEVPTWTAETTDECVAVETQRQLHSFDKLEFYSGERITVQKKVLPNGLLVGKCQDVIGLVDPKAVKRVETSS